MSAADFAKFNYRGADEEDINGLVNRNEVIENQLRNIVMSYLQKLFCQLALTKRVIEDFNRAYAPTQSDTDELKEEKTIKAKDSREEDKLEQLSKEKSATQTLHMDTCKIKHEESAQRSASS